MNDTVNKKKETEEFFAAAFCAKSATILLGEEGLFEIAAVVEIETGDSRGTIHVAHVKRKEGTG